jgi:hypothetical protein
LQASLKSPSPHYGENSGDSTATSPSFPLLIYGTIKILYTTNQDTLIERALELRGAQRDRDFTVVTPAFATREVARDHRRGAIVAGL